MKRTYTLGTLVLTAALALFLLPLIALGGGLVGAAVLSTAAQQAAGEQVDSAAVDVAGYAVAHWGELTGDMHAFESGLAALRERHAFVLEIRSLDNRVLYASPLVENGEYHPRGFSLQATQRTTLLRTPGGETLGLLQLWIWAPAGTSLLSRALAVGLWAGAATLVALLIALLWWIRRSILTPLRSLSQATVAVAEGALDFAVPGSRVRELDALGRAFDDMRQQLQAALSRQRTLEDERRRFIAAVGHDLRTPLSSIQAFAEGLRDGLARSPEKARRYAQVIVDKAREMGRLVEDLFAFARLDLPDATIRPEAVDAAEYLGAALRSFQPAADARGVQLAAVGPASLTLQVDPDLFARAVGNLVSNAIRHTPAGGRITVAWAPAEPGTAPDRSHAAPVPAPSAPGVLITVTDTGEGIPPEDLPLLFSPLHRTDRSRSRQSGGAGLGLAITARIVALHGGAITCESTVGRGTRFTIHLPCPHPSTK
jgi:signal transduction histidine kinase